MIEATSKQVNVAQIANQVWREMFREDQTRLHDSEWLMEFAERVVLAVDTLRGLK